MKRFKGTVVVTFTQEIEVDAETQEEAEVNMLDWFDPTRCWATADGRVYDLEELKG